MTRAVWIFWGSAFATVAAYAVLASFLLPFGRLELHTLTERQRAWLLTLWCGGATGVLFGTAALLGRSSNVGAREVLEAGSVAGALEIRRRSAAGAGGTPFHRSFAWWTVCTGAMLIVTYFVAGWVLGSAF